MKKRGRQTGKKILSNCNVMFNVSYMALPLPLSLSVLLTNDHTVAISGGMGCTAKWV
jgi:hypothetical protein